MVINESFETNLDCTLITRDESYVYRCSTLIDNLEQKFCIIENAGVKYPGPLSVESAKIFFFFFFFFKVYHLNNGMITRVT